ncbi:MAG: Hsp20/alpha crystallin family protein [Gammaproteobacteria bacterium]
MSHDTAASTETENKPNEAVMIPPVDVIEDSSGITLTADLPGVEKENLIMEVDANTLTIEGKLSLSAPENMEATHAEVSLPRYKRMFTLSKELDSEKISAEFKQGVLTLRIPKAQHLQPRKIPINVA